MADVYKAFYAAKEKAIKEAGIIQQRSELMAQPAIKKLPPEKKTKIAKNELTIEDMEDYNMVKAHLTHLAHSFEATT